MAPLCRVPQVLYLIVECLKIWMKNKLKYLGLPSGNHVRLALDDGNPIDLATLQSGSSLQVQGMCVKKTEEGGKFAGIVRTPMCL